ncbi:ubiquinone/menaquinone biosynthesis C-methylase UbiE [Kitasatospora sp. MAA4]|uniref:methyltransferase domain-containing protein n=1 Tax=Kitasatospora sp. MAA4 TaxID=3035093 RepID=UPI0024754821|nr:methyltransferase domain-containing protein [Kitasatospora sp. MAA4]MDH6137179.1 ubiquinone/menaquinone biosynthesis C-methylase UbiE [Kitasatospora sp. MAA4]
MTTTLGVPRPDQAAYMLNAAAADAGRAYKAQLLALLDVRAGQTALDLGCGPGTDLAAFAELVGPDGRVIGVDRDLAMLDAARRRTAELPVVRILEGDVHQLPLEDGSVDRARIDRVLMHVEDPGTVLAGLHRATRPGALVALAEPDWDTLLVDAEDLETSRAFTSFTSSVAVRNATIGRRLPRLAEQAGFTVRSVHANTPVFREFAQADYVLALGRNMQRAIEAGLVEEQRGRAWFAALEQGPFLASFTLFTVICSRGQGS